MLQIIESVGIVQKGSISRRLRLRDHQHVALIDRLPAADAGAVEAEAVLEDVLVELVDGNREVLPQAGEVHKPQIDGFDILFPAQRQDFFGCHESVLSSGNQIRGEAAAHDASPVLLGTILRVQGTRRAATCKAGAISGCTNCNRMPQTLGQSSIEELFPISAGLARHFAIAQHLGKTCAKSRHALAKEVESQSIPGGYQPQGFHH